VLSEMNPSDDVPVEQNLREALAILGARRA
jgi:hypothetical protein